MSGSLRWLAALSLVGIMVTAGPAFGQRRPPPRPAPPPRPRTGGGVMGGGMGGGGSGGNQHGGNQRGGFQTGGGHGLIGGGLGGGLQTGGGFGVLGGGGFRTGFQTGGGYGLLGGPPPGYNPYLTGGSGWSGAPTMPYGGGYLMTPTTASTPSGGGYSSSTGAPDAGGGDGSSRSGGASPSKRAQKDTPKTEILSGQALNASFRSILSSGKLKRGPHIPLRAEVLKHINLTDGGPKGRIGMLKKIDKLKWPLALKESQFDKARARLIRNLRRAVDGLLLLETIDGALLKEITVDFEALNTILYQVSDDIVPAQYIEAKLFLKRLKWALAVLSDRWAANYLANTWVPKGETVAELVSYMSKEDLDFAPAEEGDEEAYTALYQSLRAFESGMQTASK